MAAGGTTGESRPEWVKAIANERPLGRPLLLLVIEVGVYLDHVELPDIIPIMYYQHLRARDVCESTWTKVNVSVPERKQVTRGPLYLRLGPVELYRRNHVS